MRNVKLMRGLTAVFLILFAFAVGMSAIMWENEGSINMALNIETGSVSGNTAEFVYKSDYGEVNDENLSKLTADIDDFITEEMEEGAVLLYNNGTLPLAKEGLNVSLFGKAAYDPIYKNKSAGGTLDADRQITIVDAFKSIGYGVNEELYNAYANGTAVRESVAITGSTIGEEPLTFYTDAIEETYDDYKDAAIVVFARAGGEGFDLNREDADGVPQLSLHQVEKDLLDYIHAQGFEKIIVLLNTGFAMEVHELYEHHVDACIMMGTPGLTGFRGVANLINGSATPSGRLVDTFAVNSLSSPAMMNFGDYGFSNQPDLKYVVNAESIYVGYKYYETRYEDCVMGVGDADSTVGSSTGGAWNYADEVTHTFGYGLSYTTFSQELLSCEYNEETDEYTLTVKVTNTGDTYSGKDVVEVYVQSPYDTYEKTNLVEKAAVQLVGFEKSGELAPGDSEEVAVTVDRYLCASYDDTAAKTYILSEGDYYLAIGSDAHDALNNILAAKGYTPENTDGRMDAAGDAAKAYKWTVEALDAETYSVSKETGNEVTNIFEGDYAVDINDFYESDVVTYLTRQDWADTWPKSYENLEASQKLLDASVSRTYEKAADAKSVSDFTFGKDADIKFVDLADWEWNDERWDTFLDQLTLEDLAAVINNNTGAVAIKTVAKPFNRDADGPDGYAFAYAYGEKKSASCYAGQIVAAQSWNKEILRKLGHFFAEEALFCKGNEVFAPGLNLHRTPYSGRNFEYFSEDAIMSYLLAAEESGAMQAKGFISAPKHFCANDQELNRQGLCTFMTEQRIRTECMKAFEGAFTKGNAGGVMGMMGRIGVKASTLSKPLLMDALRGEWGFTGCAITDAGGSENEYQPTVDCVVSGCDRFCLTSRSSVLLKTIDSTDDGDLVQVLRDINKRYYYTRAHSNLINGLTHESTVDNVTPWWKGVVIAIDVIVGLLLVGSAACFVIFGYIRPRNKTIT